MDAEREKQALQEKLLRCRILLSEFPEGVTAKNLNDLAAELERKIRALRTVGSTKCPRHPDRLKRGELRFFAKICYARHAASICLDLPALPTPSYRDHANECLPVFLELRRLRKAA